MKSLEYKVEKAVKLLNILVKITDKDTVPCGRYYIVLRIFQSLRDRLNDERNKNLKPYVSLERKTVCYFDLPELKITSTTYERSKKRLEKQIDNRFKNR